MPDEEREEYLLFAKELDTGYETEKKQRWSSAIDYYKSVAAQYPAFSDIAIERAAMLVNEKVNRAVKYYNNGVRALQNKQYHKALQYFDLTLSVDPYMEKAQYNLALAHKFLYIAEPVSNKHNRVAAIDAFEKVLDLNSGNFKAEAQIEQLKRL